MDRSFVATVPLFSQSLKLGILVGLMGATGCATHDAPPPETGLAALVHDQGSIGVTERQAPPPPGEDFVVLDNAREAPIADAPTPATRLRADKATRDQHLKDTDSR